MEGAKQVYHVKLDSSGRLQIPSEARERHQIASGETLIVEDDSFGLRIKTLDEVIAEAQAYFAKLVPRGVLLSEEVLADRRSEIERD
jgi:bifunctional DNA-binding transcriptional regulator/antitoxin component of YhaV-PrlF toxin-antitoxin module